MLGALPIDARSGGLGASLRQFQGGGSTIADAPCVWQQVLKMRFAVETDLAAETGRALSCHTHVSLSMTLAA